MKGSYTEHNNRVCNRRCSEKGSWTPNLVINDKRNLSSKLDFIRRILEFRLRLNSDVCIHILIVFNEEIKYILNHRRTIRNCADATFSLSHFELFSFLKEKNSDVYVKFKRDLTKLLSDMYNDGRTEQAIERYIADLISQYLYHNYIQL
jgi:hypothetical protein